MSLLLYKNVVLWTLVLFALPFLTFAALKAYTVDDLDNIHVTIVGTMTGQEVADVEVNFDDGRQLNFTLDETVDMDALRDDIAMEIQNNDAYYIDPFDGDDIEPFTAIVFSDFVIDGYIVNDINNIHVTVTQESGAASTAYVVVDFKDGEQMDFTLGEVGTEDEILDDIADRLKTDKSTPVSGDFDGDDLKPLTQILFVDPEPEGYTIDDIDEIEVTIIGSRAEAEVEVEFNDGEEIDFTLDETVDMDELRDDIADELRNHDTHPVTGTFDGDDLESLTVISFVDPKPEGYSLDDIERIHVTVDEGSDVEVEFDDGEEIDFTLGVIGPVDEILDAVAVELQNHDTHPVTGTFDGDDLKPVTEIIFVDPVDDTDDNLQLVDILTRLIDLMQRLLELRGQS